MCGRASCTADPKRFASEAPRSNLPSGCLIEYSYVSSRLSLFRHGFCTFESSPALKRRLTPSRMAQPASLSAQAPAFVRALDAFRANLTPEDREDFQYTKLEDLQTAIQDIQEKQGRKSQNLARMKPFLEGMQQYGKIVEVFLNVSNVIAFVWVSELISLSC